MGVGGDMVLKVAHCLNDFLVASSSAGVPSRTAFHTATSSRQRSLTQGQQLEPQHA